MSAFGALPLSSKDVTFDAVAASSNKCLEGVPGVGFILMKNEVIKKAKEMGQFDLVIYSLASPRRTDPTDGQTYRACLKPIGSVYKNKTLDTDKKETINSRDIIYSNLDI